jgi:peptide/nickel transport system substrate-binding protein
VTRVRRKGALIAALIVAAALVLSACGGGSGGGGSVGNVKAENVGVNDINPTSDDKIKDGGTFRWPVAKLSIQFNRRHVDGSERDNSDIVNALMPTLFPQQADGTLAVNKDYLTSAEVTEVGGKQVVTLKLNPQAKWYDDTPITWEDIQSEWKALNGTNKDFVVASTEGWDQIESIDKGADDREARITFKAKYGEWKGIFGLLYPKSTTSDPVVFNTGWIEKPLTTAGPFKFDSVDRGAKTLTLVRNEKWWGKKPHLDKIVYRQIDIDAQAQAFAANDIDWINIGGSVSTFQQVQQVQDGVVRKANAPDFRHVTFNGAEGSILADPKLRIAIQKGINRDVIAKSMIGPIVPDAHPLNNHLYVEGLKAYKDNASVVAYNKDEAAKALDDLGWKKEGDVRKKDGKELVIRDVIPTATEASANESKLVQQQLGEIGVKVDIQTVQSQQFFKEYVNKGNFDITHFAWLGTATPVSSQGAIYKLDPNKVKQNYGRIGNQTINDLFNTANAELDDQKRADLANKADEEIWKSGHSLLLYQRPNAIGVRKNVANFGAFGFVYYPVPYVNIGFLK